MRKSVFLFSLAALAAVVSIGFFQGFAWKRDQPLPPAPIMAEDPAELSAPRGLAKESVGLLGAPGMAKGPAVILVVPGMAKGLAGPPVAPGMAMARAGEELFRHQWTPGDPLAKGGDGLGPVYNATSCVACHFQNGVGGSGGLTENVTTFTVRPVDQFNVEGRSKEVREGLTKAKRVQDTQPVNGRGKDVREGVLHGYSTLPRSESLEHVHADLPPVARPPLKMVLGGSGINLPPGVHLSQRNTPVLFGAKLIDDIPEQEIVANEQRQKQRWGGKGAAGTVSVVVQAIFGSSDTGDKPIGRVSRLAGGKVGRFGWKGQSASLASFVRAACANELGLGNPGQAQARPLFQPDYQPPGLDLTDEQCDQLTAYIASLPRPEEGVPTQAHAAGQARSGKKLFHKVGCADCHTPDLGEATGLYSDLLLHQMGPELEGGGSYNDPPLPVAGLPAVEGPAPGEWRTPPLWGVADSAPYLHDGRAATLEEAILVHGGQAAAAVAAFSKLTGPEQAELVAFLKTLRAPGPALATARE